MHFSHKMNVVIYHSHDVLLPFQIYSKGNWFKRIIQVSYLFFMYFFLLSLSTALETKLLTQEIQDH